MGGVDESLMIVIVILVELDWILQLRENWEIVSFFDKLVIKMR